MNKLLWLWDALVVERRLTRFPAAVNAAYERGREESYDADREHIAEVLRETVQTLDKDEEWYIADCLLSTPRES